MDQELRLTTYRKSPFHRWYLFFEHVRSTRNGLTPKVLFQCYPMKLYESERELRGGRFHHYSEATKDHPVSLPYGENHMRQQIDWIAEHTGRWNAVVIPIHGDDSEGAGDYVIRYSFEDAKDAVLFRLVFD